MPRASTLRACALNIIIQDEQKRNYVKLLKDVLRERKVVELNKVHAACLFSFSEFEERSSDNYWIGTVCRFVNVNPPYFDVSQSEILVDEEGNPKNLLAPTIKANTLFVQFCLFANQHRIFVTSNHFSPRFALAFFDAVFKSESIIEKYGIVDTILHSTKESLEEILAIPELKSIEITVHRPNPVDLNSDEYDIERMLDEQNVENVNYKLTTRKDSIKPDNITKSFLGAAISHGQIKARGKDLEGLTIEKDTHESPLIESEKYYKDEKDKNVLVRLSQKIWSRITS